MVHKVNCYRNDVEKISVSLIHVNLSRSPVSVYVSLYPMPGNVYFACRVGFIDKADANQFFDIDESNTSISVRTPVNIIRSDFHNSCLS